MPGRPAAPRTPWRMALFAVLALFFAVSCDSGGGPQNASIFQKELDALQREPEDTGPPALRRTLEVPVPGMATMVDLGADSCMPCRMMAPVLDKVARDYRDRAAVVYIDLGRHPEQSARFGVRAMPTQIFYDKTGREIGRHEGYMDRAAISEVLDTLLAR
ncbi:MAG: thioredoxin family protein [Desulfovibrionaceae bacterium]|nr:thioredoxin family protein [Desulfovibrionaceae bacterium]